MFTREPEGNAFLVEIIATGVCHTDISGYDSIYPRVHNHEGMSLSSSIKARHAHDIMRWSYLQNKKREAETPVVVQRRRLDHPECCSLSKPSLLQSRPPAYCINYVAVFLAANVPSFVLASDRSKVIGGDYFRRSFSASPVPAKLPCASTVTSKIKDAE